MNLDIGYIIVNPDNNLSGLRISMSSIGKHHFGIPEIIQILPKGTNAADVKKHKEVCVDTFKGGDTITSLINTGFKKLKAEWGMVIFAGSVLKTNTAFRYEKFVTSDKDVFYPVIGNKYNFVDGSTNGLAVNRKFFNEIGDFPENHMWKLDEDANINSFEICKFMWAEAAIERGCKFKGMIGCKFG